MYGAVFMAGYEQVDLAYEFLCAKEREGASFTKNELAEVTGWKVGTCSTYLSKRWYQYVRIEQGSFIPHGVTSISKVDFRRIHSQKLQPLEDQSEVGLLIKKSKEFALLAVSTYNNPFTNFKTHGFIINLIIAYTALFHAIFERRGDDYYYRDKKGDYKLADGEKKAWELTTCIKMYWQGNKTAEQANLEFLIGLRNKIEHRSLPALDLGVAGYCQSALSNFETILLSEFGDSHTLMASLAIAMQLTRTSQEEQIDAMKKFQTDNYRVIRDYMETYAKDLDDDILESHKYRLRAFLIPKIGGTKKSADLALEFVDVSKLTLEQRQSYDQAIALIKGVESPYKLKPSKVTDRVKGVHNWFSIHWHTQSWRMYEVRPSGDNIDPELKNKYVGYVEGYDNYLYSNVWVDFLIEKFKDKSEIERLKTFK